MAWNPPTESTAPSGPHQAGPPPAPAAFRDLDFRPLVLVLGLLLPAIGAASLLTVYLGLPDDGCARGTVSADEATLLCGPDGITGATTALGGVGLLGMFGGLGVFATWRKPWALTVDERGINYARSAKADARPETPLLPWPLVRHALVVEREELDLGDAVDLQGQNIDFSPLLVVDLRVPPGQDDPWPRSYISELGGHVLCKLSRVAGRGPDVMAAIDAHLNYRSSLGLQRVTVTDPQTNRLTVAATLHTFTGFRSTFARDALQSGPAPVLEGVTPAEAERVRQAFERAGVSAAVEPMPATEPR